MHLKRTHLVSAASFFPNSISRPTIIFRLSRSPVSPTILFLFRPGYCIGSSYQGFTRWWAAWREKCKYFTRHFRSDMKKYLRTDVAIWLEGWIVNIHINVRIRVPFVQKDSWLSIMIYNTLLLSTWRYIILLNFQNLQNSRLVTAIKSRLHLQVLRSVAKKSKNPRPSE